MSLVLGFAPGLAFAVRDPSPELERLLRRYFRPQVAATPAPQGAVQIVAEPSPGLTRGQIVLRDGPIVVCRDQRVVRLEAAGITAWMELGSGRAGIDLRRPSPAALEALVARGLTSFLFELALDRGFLGLHAAAVAPAGRGILLPGASGTGKTTVFRSCHAAGLPVLSDDLVLVRPGREKALVHPFERGVPSEPVPAPTLAWAVLHAVVCPSIVPSGPSRLEPVSAREAAEALLVESPFLASGPAAGERFRTLVRLAANLPTYRLLAGPERSEVPTLLAALSALGRQQLHE